MEKKSKVWKVSLINIPEEYIAEVAFTRPTQQYLNKVSAVEINLLQVKRFELNSLQELVQRIRTSEKNKKPRNNNTGHFMHCNNIVLQLDLVKTKLSLKINTAPSTGST